MSYLATTVAPRCVQAQRDARPCSRCPRWEQGPAQLALDVVPTAGPAG